jgi:DNA-binding LytR/AlgR family response regulator
MIKVLITDDEPIARQIVRTYCEQYGSIEIVAECETALETLPFLQKNDIDLMFMDINMPGVDGVSFIKALTVKPKIIFTTAYKEYAIDAFDLKAHDYLLKPFSYERFLKAIENIDIAEKSPVQEVKSDDNYLVIKNGKTMHRIFYDELLYCEAQLNYVRFATKDGDIIAYQTLSDTEKQLPDTVFIRSHRSFIINKNKVKTIDGNQILFDKTHIAMIGANYREEFLRKIGM